MKKAVLIVSILSMAINSALAAEEIGTIQVTSTKLSDVSGEEVKSADLAEALTKKLPNVSIVRRSGIANDIILRGQKKDNINITIDNTKVYGACPNRMDPPTSHILTNTIDSIEVTEGPYDVENFGTLSGSVAITTKAPSKELKGEVSLNMGSFDYRKTAATVSGGNDAVRFLLSVSNETSSQYEDGDGNTFAEQIENFNPSTMLAMDPRYKNIYRDMDAYEKSAVLGKVFINLAENQEMRLSYTANRSDDVLYPSSKMDALYDDSNIFNLEYSIKDLGKYSKSLDLQYYRSEVDHPMSTFYRNSSSSAVGTTDSDNEKISALTTDMQGLKIKDTFDLSSTSEMTVGIDTSTRNWDGTYEGKGTNMMMTGRKSIDDVDTENSALFAEVEKKYSDISVKVGMRYDDTSITPSASSGLQSNDYNNFSANVFATYKADSNSQYFAGIGKASRVPDARELYFKNGMGALIGTPTLDETTNTEIDFGVENTYDNFNIKTKIFYSMLKNYIYYNVNNLATPGMVKNAFENVDATIYGMGISGAYFVSDEINIDFGLAYQKAEKDTPLAGQTDTDLAEVPPMKANIALNYDYSLKNTASIELVAADAWDDFDSDNGEQAMKGYGVVNMKVKHDVTKNFELTAGVDNLLDKTYTTTNTYKDLTLLADGAGDVMLINEPGRYLYVNGSYKF